jgi:estrogen-related receptor beta like 1
MCENSIEKLKLLNYEQGYCKRLNKAPLHRIHFAIPGANAFHQFDDFVNISSWLCTEVTGKADTFRIEQSDDPNVIVNKLMLALRQLDFRSNFPAQKLRTPFGEPVCTVLDFLTDKALAAKGFEFREPFHPANEELEQIGDEGQEDDEIAEDDGVAVDDEVFFEDASRLETSVSLDATAHHMIHAQIDPIAWKTELERVGPKLRAQQMPSTNEWRAHVDQTVTTKAQIEKLMGDSANELFSMNKQLNEELGQLRMKEKYINNQYNTLCLEYSDVKKKLDELDKVSSVSREGVSKLTSELTEISEKLEELKESFESKDSGLHDTSPLVKIKAALQQLREEIHEFDTRIGVVSNQLLMARVADHNRSRAKAASKAKQRQKGRKRGSNGGGDEEDDASVGSRD